MMIHPHPDLTDIFPRWRPTKKLLHYNMEIQQKPQVTGFMAASQPTPFLTYPPPPEIAGLMIRAEKTIAFP